MESTEIQITLRTIVEEVITETQTEDGDTFPHTKYKFKYLPAYLHLLGPAELQTGDRVKITITKEPVDAQPSEPNPRHADQ